MHEKLRAPKRRTGAVILIRYPTHNVPGLIFFSALLTFLAADAAGRVRNVRSAPRRDFISTVDAIFSAGAMPRALPHLCDCQFGHLFDSILSKIKFVSKTFQLIVF